MVSVHRYRQCVGYNSERVQAAADQALGRLPRESLGRSIGESGIVAAIVAAVLTLCAVVTILVLYG